MPGLAKLKRQLVTDLGGSGMLLRHVGKILIGIIVVSAYLYWPEWPSFEHRQVKGLAVAEDNFLLPVYPHISQIERPKETYNFPINIGQSGPASSLYSGRKQYPFYCMTLDSELGQPLVDNQQGLGVPVYANSSLDGPVIGFSKDCLIKTRVNIYYLDVDKALQLLHLEQHPTPDSIKDAAQPLRLFRAEQGSINRFIYTLATPINWEERYDRLSFQRWNKRLIYQFNGGSGIGFRQGRQKATKIISKRLAQLEQGYAVISSSGNRTSYTYNMLLAEDTARRVKRQFTSLYGEPLYTVGIGGSGGGLAQYLIGQNSSGILNALIPLYSYPDMLSQTIYALDCDLINTYFTFRAKDQPRWQDWSQRQLIEGMNTLADFPQRAGFLQPIAQLYSGVFPRFPSGNSECINGWFGLSTFVHNPRQGFINDYYSEDVVAQTNWSYWEDMVWLYQRDETGLARITWDNEGVQYGLAALKTGQITIDEFLHFNTHIGGWKPQHEMQAEEIMLPFGRKVPVWLSLWSKNNVTAAAAGQPAPRHIASLQAIEAAYRGGQVFLGQVDLPIIDVRHYLEDSLNMHHVSASFSARARILDAQGQHHSQVIWVAHEDYDPQPQAFAMMDAWMLNIANNPNEPIANLRPPALTDRCYDAKGEIIASGEKVWDGQWNQAPDGLCTQHYPPYPNSRIQAGGPWQGSIFKCQLISLSEAVEKGTYGNIDVTPHLNQLKQIFPSGVCDYLSGDLGRPSDL